MISLTLVFLLISSAVAQRGVVQVIRVDEIMPLLGSLMNTGNLKGGKSFSLEEQIPLITSFLTNFNTYENLKDQAVPTLAPSPQQPPIISRTAADLGIASAAVKNTLSAVAALPARTIASGGTAISNVFKNEAKEILATPSQINELLKFQHELFSNYLAGFQQGVSVVSPEGATEAQEPITTKLREDIMRLAVVEPRLNDLLSMLEHPRASGVVQALSNAFDTAKFSATSEGLSTFQNLIIDPTTMQVAFSNIALNFLRSILQLGGISQIPS